MIRTSPGWSVSAGKRWSMARTARGSVRLKTGMARGEWARELPRASTSSQPKSCASPMMSENAVRQTVSQHSSTRLISRLHMISRPTGSASIRAMVSSRVAPAGASATGGPARPMASRRFRWASTSRRSPGGTTVVDSRSSTMAGPSSRSPGRSA